MSAIHSIVANRPPNWNYRPDAIPTRCLLARPSRNPIHRHPITRRRTAEQMNAQQKAYTEALLEQNRALNQRIQELQKQDSTIQGLHEEIERLKKELDAQPRTEPPRKPARSPHQKRTTVFPRWMAARYPKETLFPIRAT